MKYFLVIMLHGLSVVAALFVFSTALVLLVAKAPMVAGVLLILLVTWVLGKLVVDGPL